MTKGKHLTSWEKTKRGACIWPLSLCCAVENWTPSTQSSKSSRWLMTTSRKFWAFCCTDLTSMPSRLIFLALSAWSPCSVGVPSCFVCMMSSAIFDKLHMSEHELKKEAAVYEAFLARRQGQNRQPIKKSREHALWTWKHCYVLLVCFSWKWFNYIGEIILLIDYLFTSGFTNFRQPSKYLENTKKKWWFLGKQYRVEGACQL